MKKLIHIQTICKTSIAIIDENGNTERTESWQQTTGYLTEEAFIQMFRQVKKKFDEQQKNMENN